MALFLSNDNVKLMWDIIIEHDDFILLSPSNKHKTFNIYHTNLKPFYKEEKKLSTDLLTLNKKYIQFIINNLPKSEINEAITNKEIQNEKLYKFDNDLNKITIDFENTIKPKIPTKPDFQDKKIDTPITEMEQKLKEITAQRNYDIQYINETNPNSVKATLPSVKATLPSVNDWLKPVETSVKSSNNIKSNFSNTNSNTKLKYLNLEQNDFPSLIKENSVSFSDVTNNLSRESNNSILKKLKKIDTTTETKKHAEHSVTLENDRIYKIEENIKQLSDKIEMILSSLNNKTP